MYSRESNIVWKCTQAKYICMFAYFELKQHKLCCIIYLKCENSYKYEKYSISKPITNASVSDYWTGYGKLYGDIQYTCQTATDEPLSSSFKTFWHLFGHNIELPLHDIYHKQDLSLISTRQSIRTFNGVFIIGVFIWSMRMLGLYLVYVESLLGLCNIVYAASMLAIC